MRLIADSGSTKTTWCLVAQDGNKSILRTQGINPFLLTENQIVSILETELIPKLSNSLNSPVSVSFYGAGCTPEKSKVVHSALIQVFQDGNMFVGSDLLGAARALCGHNEGIACILGTGSNSCHFDGTDIVENVPPLGYILGDEGSGAYIGKHLVANCLKRQFSDEISALFFEETNLSPFDVIERVYRQALPNRFLASLSEFCARHREIPELHDFLISCFKEFFKRNILQYRYIDLPVHFTGSIAWFYRQELLEAAETMNIKVGRILHEPIKGIVEYELSHC